MGKLKEPEELQAVVDDSEKEEVKEKTKMEVPEEPKKPRKYRGVTYHRKNNKWVAQASVNGKSKYLGTHPTPEHAAKVYDAFVISTFGKNVKTNFPVKDVDFSLLPRLRTYKKPHQFDMGFGMMGMTPMFVQPPAVKDPKRPKHPKNAYLQFAAEQRRTMKEQGMSFPGRGNMHKQFSERWNGLEGGEKQKYIDLAEADRRRFEQEMEGYADPDAYSWMNTGQDAFHWLRPQMVNISGNQQQFKQEQNDFPGASMPPAMPSNDFSQNMASMASMFPKPEPNGQNIIMPPGFMSMLPNCNVKTPIELPGHQQSSLIIRDDSKVKFEKVQSHQKAPELNE